MDEKTHVFNREIKKEQRDDGRAVACILQPNEASLHEARLIHSSPPNTSAMRRCGYSMRYMPTSVKWAEESGHQIYLARGKDLAGNRYADPDKAYPELAKWREVHKRGGH